MFLKTWRILNVMKWVFFVVVVDYNKGGNNCFKDIPGKNGVYVISKIIILLK